MGVVRGHIKFIGHSPLRVARSEDKACQQLIWYLFPSTMMRIWVPHLGFQLIHPQLDAEQQKRTIKNIMVDLDVASHYSVSISHSSGIFFISLSSSYVNPDASIWVGLETIRKKMFPLGRKSQLIQNHSWHFSDPHTCLVIVQPS